MKVKQDISQELDETILDQGISAKYMAHDLGKTETDLSKDRRGFTKANADEAVEYHKYLNDAKFGSQMSAKFFDQLAMLNTSKWAQKFQDAPFATWNKQLWSEDKRRKTGVRVHQIMLEPRETWTDEETRLVVDWMYQLIENVSLATLDLYQTADVAEMDLVQLMKLFNERNAEMR